MTTIVYIALSILGVIFILSVWANIFLLKRLLFVSENLDDLLYMVTNFSLHLEKVNNMETFYGDEVLGGLLDHSKELREDLTQIISNYEYKQEAAQKTQ